MKRKEIYTVLIAFLVISPIIVKLVLWPSSTEQVSAPITPATEDHQYTGKPLIRVDSPRPGQTITSPTLIQGEARGPWFFEADFPVVVVNWDGLIIGEAIARAQGEWMTEEFVPFEAELYFDFDPRSYSDRGTIILHKHNASGLPEHDDAIEMDIILKAGGLAQPNPGIEQGRRTRYKETGLGFSFEYEISQNAYVITEPPLSDRENPDLLKAIILTRKVDYEELLKSEGPREGPPTINIYVFQPKGSSVLAWLKAEQAFTNFSEGGEESYVIGGEEGIRFFWDGLFQGESIAVLKNDKMYLLVSAYLNGVEDGRRNEFRELVNSFTFTE